MRKTFSILSSLLLASMVLMMFASPANALPGSNWATGIKLQNLDTTVTAEISVQLRDAAGSLVDTISTTSTGDPLTAAPESSVEIYLPAYTTLSTGQFSAVISSNVQLGVVATMTNYEFGIADSYNSMLPASTVNVPYVYHNHNSYYTEIYVQNTTGSEITGTMTFTEPAGGVSSGDGIGNKTIPVTIPANGTFNLNTSDPIHNDLGWFIGSATITMSNDVTVVANQLRIVGNGDTPGNLLIQSRGLTLEDGGTTIVLPSLYKNFTGASGTWVSGIKLVNPSSAAIDAVVTFKSDDGAFTGVKTVNISANGNEELYLPGVVLDSSASIPDMFLGSAKIESTGVVVATVQHTNYSAGDGYGVGLGYAGFSNGSSEISLPSLYKWPSGAGVWISGIKVQNLSADEVTVTINLSSDADVAAWTGTKTVVLAGFEAKELYLGGSDNLDGNASVPQPWKGSALVTATGSGTVKIVSTVLHTNYGRHVANMYTGVNIAP